MSEIERITLIFQPRDFKKPVNFTYKIKKGDYKKFTDILLHFSYANLSDKEIKTIIKTYPKLDIDINEENTIEDIFNQSCVIDGVTKINENTYKIKYST